VSHAAERTEKNCLNCGTTVVGRFCHVCGQENIVPKESFGKLVIHFFYDITHFDSKFFDTLKYLLFRPGFLSREYIGGRRANYLNPVRMYVFTSAIFFLIFFNINKKNFNSNVTMKLSNEDRIEMANELKNKLTGQPGDSIIQNKISALLDTSKNLPFKIGLFDEKIYNSLHEYDSIQSTLPGNQRDGWFTSLLIRKALKLTDENPGNIESVKEKFTNSFLHTLPYLLFLSLPFFAAILKLLYIRRKFYYSDHAILTIHHYIFSFVLLLLTIGAFSLYNWLGWGILVWLGIILIICWPLYLYFEMKNFYGQGIFKTLIKFLLLNTLASVVLMILFLVFLFLSIIQL
jgi:uncharacterized protein DUF3667